MRMAVNIKVRLVMPTSITGTKRAVKPSRNNPAVKRLVCIASSKDEDDIVRFVVVVFSSMLRNISVTMRLELFVLLHRTYLT